MTEAKELRKLAYQIYLLVENAPLDQWQWELTTEVGRGDYPEDLQIGQEPDAIWNKNVLWFLSPQISVHHNGYYYSCRVVLHQIYGGKKVFVDVNVNQKPTPPGGSYTIDSTVTNYFLWERRLFRRLSKQAVILTDRESLIKDLERSRLLLKNSSRAK